MKQIVSFFVLVFFSFCSFAQMMTADEVSTTFSPKNLMSNRPEYSLSAIIQLNFGFSLVENSVEQIIVQKDDVQYVCVYNEQNQLKEITSAGKTLCKLTYNSKGKVEVVNLVDKIIAITYDKKGRVASEACLYPHSDNAAMSQHSSSKLIVTEDYVFLDEWSKSLTSPRIYLLEILDDSKVKEWAIDAMYLYDYKGNGSMKEKIVTASNNTRDAVYSFTYKKNALQQQIKSYTNSPMVESSTYLYENGRLTKVNKGYFKRAKRNPPLISSETNTMVYDSVGNLLEYSSYDGYRYDYCVMNRDSKNRIMKVQKKQENGEMTPMFQCEYNDQDYVVKSVNGRSVCQYTYEFDAQGNWTSLTVVENGKTKTITRQISYKK